MHSQNFRLFLYSSVAILALTLVWGFKQIPQQRQLAERTLRASLEQELIVLSSAVKASTNALRFRLLDVLKAEGNDRPTRAFQDSPFVSATLMEWDQAQWRFLWHSSKNRSEATTEEVKNWMKDWPLAKLANGETYFAKVGDIQGTAHFAVVVPVRKPNAVPMIGVGIFPATQFGLMFSAERTRDVKVFDDKGYALALSRPAYLGSSLRREPLAEIMFEGEEVSARHQWSADGGKSVLGGAVRISDSNLIAAIEAPVGFGNRWVWQAWLYLILCAVGALVVNWWLLNSLVRPLLTQISQSDKAIEQLKRTIAEGGGATHPAVSRGVIIQPELDEYTFVETPEVSAVETEPPVTRTALNRVIQAALRSLDPRLKEHGIRVQTTGIDGIEAPMDALQLQTAIEEVLKNSIEAMETSETRWLTILAEKRGDRAHLTIEDTGIGIDPDKVEKVFDPFYSTKDVEGVSRGLGLNVVRRVLEEMQGSVKVTSQPGTLTTVEMEWPLPTDTPMKQTSKPSAQVIPAAPVMVTTAVAKAKESLLELSDGDDFESMIMQAPLVPSRHAARDWPDVAIRKPKVRSLEN